MNQRREPDSKTNTEILEQTKSISQPRRARPKTKRQAPTNLVKSFKSEPSFSLKPNLPASNRRGKHNSNHTNHHSGSLSHKTSYICSIHNKIIPASNRRGKHDSDHTNHHSGSLLSKTSYICSIHNKWLSSWNDQKNHFAKQFSLIYTQGRHKIMAPKSFVLDLILTPLNQYPVLGCVSDVTSSRLSHEQIQSNRVCCFQLCSFTVFLKDSFFGLFSLFYSLLETPNSCFCKTWDKMVWVEYLRVLIWCRKIIDWYV